MLSLMVCCLALVGEDTPLAVTVDSGFSYAIYQRAEKAAAAQFQISDLMVMPGVPESDDGAGARRPQTGAVYYFRGGTTPKIVQCRYQRIGDPDAFDKFVMSRFGQRMIDPQTEGAKNRKRLFDAHKGDVPVGEGMSMRMNDVYFAYVSGYVFFSDHDWILELPLAATVKLLRSLDKDRNVDFLAQIDFDTIPDEYRSSVIRAIAGQAGISLQKRDGEDPVQYLVRRTLGDGHLTIVKSLLSDITLVKVSVAWPSKERPCVVRGTIKVREGSRVSRFLGTLPEKPVEWPEPTLEGTIGSVGLAVRLPSETKEFVAAFFRSRLRFDTEDANRIASMVVDKGLNATAAIGLASKKAYGAQLRIAGDFRNIGVPTEFNEVELSALAKRSSEYLPNVPVSENASITLGRHHLVVSLGAEDADQKKQGALRRGRRARRLLKARLDLSEYIEAEPVRRAIAEFEEVFDRWRLIGLTSSKPFTSVGQHLKQGQSLGLRLEASANATAINLMFEIDRDLGMFLLARHIATGHRTFYSR